MSRESYFEISFSLKPRDGYFYDVARRHFAAYQGRMLFAGFATKVTPGRGTQFGHERGRLRWREISSPRIVRPSVRQH